MIYLLIGHNDFEAFLCCLHLLNILPIQPYYEIEDDIETYKQFFASILNYKKPSLMLLPRNLFQSWKPTLNRT